MKKGTIEWSALLICEIVFGFVGTLFTALGVIFGVNIEKIAASPNSQGDVRILPWVFGGVGAVLLLVSVILLFVSVKKKNLRRQLIASGSCINARVTEIQQDLSVRVNRKHPYYVICEGRNPYTGETLTFRSANMMEPPHYLLGGYLRVFVDYNNPGNYFVETKRNYET